MLDIAELISPYETEGDEAPPILPSPNRLGEFIGQESSKLVLRKVLAAEENIPPILISSPPGLGKSTLAICLAKEQGKDYNQIMGFELDTPDNLYGTVEYLSSGDIVVIDEAQTMPLENQVHLQTALETGVITGWDGRKKRVGIILVTMNQTKLLRSLRDRCILQLFLDYYSIQDLSQIAYNSREYFGLEVEDPAGYSNIAIRSRGLPRLALRLSKLISYWKPQNTQQVSEALAELGIDKDGLTKQDRLYLDIIRKANRPQSLRTISAITGIDEAVLKEDIEPYLMRAGWMEVTGRGRVATKPKNRRKDD